MRRKATFSVIVILSCISVALLSCQEQSQPLGPASNVSDPGGQDLGDGNPILGKPAPAFVTVDPYGNAVDLNKHLGKDVIMLDFWATWCAPCIMAMPEIQEVAERFKDRGLVFYAVNAGEDPDTVKEFLAQYKLNIPVAMDFEGEIQNAFQADGLPHTYLIGKDGTVQVVHRGYRRGFGEELSDQVEALLDGKNLVGK